MTDLVVVMRVVCGAVIASREHLCQLDAALGDGDHGVSMAKTFSAVQVQLDEFEGVLPAEALDAIGDTILTSVGGAMGPLFGSAFKAAAAEIGSAPSARSVAAAILAAREAVAELGEAKPGDKTMLDALDVAATSAARAAQSGVEMAGIVAAAADGAERGAGATAQMRATVGRASRLGERSVGTPDPGATSVAIIFRAAADAMSAESDPASTDEAAGLSAEGGSR